MATLTATNPEPRFRHHVSFDNIPTGETTKSNSLGFTVNLTHHGFQPQRRSRTLMVGVDQHSYSDFALQWLLEEFADDGDEIICVHVTDKDPKSVEDKDYKALVYKMVDNVKAKIPEHCAISIKFEYAVGKLHASFQNLIKIYQPSMLVVGTRGRSLGGFQGLVNTNSFSKYCLQYSPIPTVVVRDNEKRLRKKEKREKDPGRKSYVSMLSKGRHEADSEASSLYDMEKGLSPDEEAHRVARAIGLPAQFDPTLKPINMDQFVYGGGRRGVGSPTASPSTSAPPSPKLRTVDPTQLTGAPAKDSDDEDSSDDDGGFEVMSGKQAQQKDQAIPKEQKAKLHRMEMSEGLALRAMPSNVEDEDSS